MVTQGVVYWITGLSGSGKTTISHLLVSKLRAEGRPTILLDGDLMREALAPIMANWPAGFAFGREARTSLGLTYGRLAAELSRQGMDVVCATISMFHEVFRWNRENIGNYREIYLKVPIDVLTKRDPKGIYARNLQNNSDQVAGIGLATEEPLRADLVIENHGETDPEAALARIWSALVLRFDPNARASDTRR